MWKKRYGVKSGRTTSSSAGAKMARNKFHNKKTIYEGVEFDSAFELTTYKFLLDQKAKGVIKDVIAHPPTVELLPNSNVDVPIVDAKGKEKIKQRTLFKNLELNPDFLITLNNGKEVYLDSKSYATLTDSYKIKVKILYNLHNTLCVTFFKPEMDNFSIVVKLLEKGNFLQFFSKGQSEKYYAECKSGRYGKL
jgi:hypothetical protein